MSTVTLFITIFSGKIYCPKKIVIVTELITKYAFSF